MRNNHSSTLSYIIAICAVTPFLCLLPAVEMISSTQCSHNKNLSASVTWKRLLKIYLENAPLILEVCKSKHQVKAL